MAPVLLGSSPNSNEVHQEKPSARKSFDPLVSESHFLFELSLLQLWLVDLLSSTSIIYLQPVLLTPSAIFQLTGLQSSLGQIGVHECTGRLYDMRTTNFQEQKIAVSDISWQIIP